MEHLYEKTVASDLLFDGRIIKVYRDTAQLENGATATREVVRHNGGVCVSALTEKNELLFVKQFRYPYGKVIAEVPAGKLEKGEDPLECGKRELSEETGFEAGEFVSLGHMFPSPGYCSEIIYIFLARGLTPSAQHLDDDEFLDVLRIPVDKAVEMVLGGEIEDAKTQIAVLKTAALLNKGI